MAALALLWGSSFLWTKVALEGLTAAQTVVVRLTLAAAVLVPVAYALGHRMPASRGLWLHLGVAAVFGNVVPYVLFAVGLEDIDSAAGGMLNATTPLWTLLLAIAVRQTKNVSRAQLVGIVVALAGTLLIFTPWDLGTQFTTWAAFACLCAAFSYAISYVYLARFLAGRDISPLVLSAGQLVAASLISILVVMPVDGLAAPVWRFDVVASVVILGVLGTGVAYILNYRIISDDGPVAASAVVYLLPLVAVGLGVLVLDERPAPTALAGVVVVLAGVALTRWNGRPPSRRDAVTGRRRR